MVMLDPGELMVPVAAGPVRGPRYARLLLKPARRRSPRAIPAKPRHRLDVAPASTGSSGRTACSVVVNVYGRTRLRMVVDASREKEALSVSIDTALLRGDVRDVRGFARLVGPARDLISLVRKSARNVPRSAKLDTGDEMTFDAAKLLARLEASDPKIGATRDEELSVVSHHGGAPHVHVAKVSVPGVYHVGLLIEGLYDPASASKPGGHDGHNPGPGGKGPERFVRLLSASAGVSPGDEKPAPKRAAVRKSKERAKDAGRTVRSGAGLRRSRSKSCLGIRDPPEEVCGGSRIVRLLPGTARDGLDDDRAVLESQR